MRRALLRYAGAAVEDTATFGPSVRILGPKGLVVGKGVGVARGSCLDARAGLSIGDHTLIGFESVLLTWTHNWDNPDVPLRDQGSVGRPIRVGANAWVGTRAILLPGVAIGDASVVGAGSVVTRSVAPGQVVAGSPARPIRERKPQG